MKLKDINEMKLRGEDVFLKFRDSNDFTSTDIYIPDNSSKDDFHWFEVIKASEKASKEVSPGDIVLVPWAMTRGIVDFEDAEGEKYTFSDVQQIMLVWE